MTQRKIGHRVSLKKSVTGVSQMKKGILFFSALLLSSVSWADGWSEALTVTNVFTEGNTDYIVIYTTQASSTTYGSGCSKDHWVFTGDNDARRARAYATAMTALVS